MTDPDQHDDPLVRTSLNGIDFAEEAIAEGKITEGRDELDARENGIGIDARNQRIAVSLDEINRMRRGQFWLDRRSLATQFTQELTASIRRELGIKP